MSHESETRSSLARFFDSFFQERNIRWMLGLGLLLLLGSSMMLVKNQWEAYSPFWKYLVLIAYTTAIFLWGEFSYFRLGLRKTGTVLQSLTVLLLPLSFAALRWVRPEGDFTLSLIAGQVGLLFLLALNFVVASVAATRIFAHFLRRTQPTFVAAYLVLCLAGALLPLMSGAASYVAVAVLWGVFTIGAVKVSRHVFWLAEEYHWPRVCGFFPILLLGTQFATLFAFNVAPQIPSQWMGLACALIAVPVMLTADAILAVYQQRTGDLVRPLPWSLILPTAAGLVLCATGIALAATGWPTPYALVPTAALVAALMGVTASRTRNPAFVWGMLFSILLAYNFSPVFFMDAVNWLRDAGAGAVREPRLPFAFYGLTYLPLLGAAIGAQRWMSRRQLDVFAVPTRRFIVGLSAVLLAASLSHAKAMFPVGLAMTAGFVLQAVLFGDRRLLAGSVVGWITAAVGLTPFLEGVLELTVPADMFFLSLGGASLLLLWPGGLLDRRRAFSTRHPNTGEAVNFPLHRWVSLSLSLWLPLFWLQQFVLQPSAAVCWPSGLLLVMLLAIHGGIWVKSGIGDVAIVFAGLVGVSHAFRWNVPVEMIHSAVALILAAMWCVAPRLRRNPDSRFAQGYGGPIFRVSLAGLAILLTFNTLTFFVQASGAATFSLDWIPALIVLIWAFDAARRIPHAIFSTAGCVGVLSFASCLWMTYAPIDIAGHWLPAFWGAIGLAAVPIGVGFGSGTEMSQADADRRGRCAVFRPIFLSSVVLLLAVGGMSLFVFTTPLRVAGGIAAAGLLLLAVLRSEPLVSRFAIVVANWQVVSLVVQWFTPANASIFSLTFNDQLACCLPVAAVGALSLFGSLLLRENGSRVEILLQVHRGLLRLMIALSMFVSLFAIGGVLDAAHVISALIAFSVWFLFELLRGVAKNSVERVWLALGIAALGVGYFVLIGVLHLVSGASMYLALGAGMALCGIGRFVERKPSGAVVSEPFQVIGTALPMLTAGLGLVRHVMLADPEWLGVNSLALLGSAAFYFWRGIDRKQNVFLVLSAAILNIGLALLWRELEFSDPQFFMIPIGISILWLVQVLKREIPAKLHDPLRYLGALVILVSPVFHIVAGSWIHLVTLMVASIVVTLIAIGLRIRAITYTGTAFLVADVVAMVVRGSIDHPMLLWVVGILAGAGVIALAAYCEKHREVENPERMLHQLIIDMEEELDSVRNSVAETIADEIQMGKQVRKALAESDEWMDRATTALERHDEEKSKAALEQKIRADQRVETLQAEYEEQKKQTADLQRAVTDLEDKIRQARRKRTLLVARLARAESVRKIDRALDTTTSRSAFAQFARLEQRVERTEAVSEAHDRMQGRDTDAEELERQFEDDERRQRVERELEELKQRVAETRELLIDAEKGDAAAVNRLLDRHRESLRRMVGFRMDRKIANRLDASDVVQDVLLEANRRLRDYLRDPKLPFHLWLRQLARDRVIDMHRRHRGARRRSVDREQQPAAAYGDRSSIDLAGMLRDPELTPAAATIRQELQRRFFEAMEGLSDDDREVLLMRHQEHLSNSDVAAALGMSAPAAGMRYLRALRRLREVLGEESSLG
eukprot:g8446.t1